MYNIHYRKCSLQKGEFVEKEALEHQHPNNHLEFCNEAQSVLNENDIKLLLDRDIIDAIRHDSINRMVQLLKDSNRINDLSQRIDYNYEGNTLLHEAIYWNSNKCILYLLKNCTNFMDAKNKDGNTVLHIACLKGHSYLINELYKLGSDINSINNKQEIILHCAVKCGNLEIVKQVYSLINAPCCLSRKDKAGRKPLHTAVISRNRTLEIIKFLVNEGSDLINVDTLTKNSIMANLNRLEKSSLNIQVKTLLQKAVYDVYNLSEVVTMDPTDISSTMGQTDGSICKKEPHFIDYSTLIETYPEYAPFVIEGEGEDEEDTTINQYKVSYPSENQIESKEFSESPSKKILPIKFRKLFEYDSIEPFETNTTIKKGQPTTRHLYKELIAISLLFLLAFLFYYE
tara:strand:+ start:80 stop:1279 length:1200 start_codon:yes stop_codon:yes gene_type:complete